MRAIEDSRRYPGAYQFEADLNQDPVSV